MKKLLNLTAILGLVISSFGVITAVQAAYPNYDNLLLNELISGDYYTRIFGSFTPENYTYNSASDSALFESYGMRVKIWPEVTSSGASAAVFDYWDFSSNCGSTDATNTCIYYDYTYEGSHFSDVDAYFVLGEVDTTQTAYQETYSNTGNFTEAHDSKPVVLTYQYKLTSTDTAVDADNVTVTLTDVDTNEVYYRKTYTNLDTRANWKTVKDTLPAEVMTKQLKFNITVENNANELTQLYLQKVSVAQYEKHSIEGDIVNYSDDSDTVAGTVVELTNRSGSEVIHDKILSEDGAFRFANLKKDRGYGIRVTTPEGRTQFQTIPKMRTRINNKRSFLLAFY